MIERIYIYSSCYYHHQIGSTNLSNCYHIFRWLCAWNVCFILSLIAYTFLENRDFGSIIIVQFMMSANCRMRFGFQIVFVCVYITLRHYHYCVIYLKIIKCLSDMFCRVCELLCRVCQLSLMQYNISGCVFSLPFPFDDWENTYTLSYHHHQIGSMNYYPLFRVRSWNNGLRCMSLYSYGCKYHTFSITARSPKGQWVKPFVAIASS